MTGGLADTVIPFDGSNLDVANGFGFMGADPLDLYLAAWLGVLNHRDRDTWKSLQKNGMACDFSWDRSARVYEDVYRRAVA
jgi:starch synthase